MFHDCETMTITVQGPFGEEHRIRLVRQENGEFREADEVFDAPRASTHADQDDACESVTARIQGIFGEDHRIRLVRQPGGTYEEVLETCDVGQP